MNIDDIAHKIAMFAIEQTDNVNMYSAMKSKMTELLNEDDGWQPIEDMPRELKIYDFKILGWDGYFIHTVEYRPDFYYPAHIYHKEQWIQISDSGRATLYDITHWRPLPKPPNQK